MWEIAMYRTGAGPYRKVADSELRYSFHLGPQTAKVFALKINYPPFAGSESPLVTPFLRALLYIMLDTASQRQELRREINAKLDDRNFIPIRAKLLSLIDNIPRKPWDFPPCLSTEDCKRYWKEMSKVATVSGIPSDRTGDAVTGMGVSYLLRNLPQLAWGGALLNQFTGQSKDYYDFYARRLQDELALRGIPPSTLQ
jgi:hypothetical protein